VIWVVWAGLAVLIGAFVAGGTFVAVRALEAWRTLRATQAEALDRLAEAGERAADVAEKAATVTESPELDRTLERLRESLRRFNILRSALAEATDAVGRVTAVYPRK
jgi:pilus assembly protein TadC